MIDRANKSRQSQGGQPIPSGAITTDVTVPSPITCFEGMKVNSVACGENHSLALITQFGDDKSLWAWGNYRNA